MVHNGYESFYYVPLSKPLSTKVNFYLFKSTTICTVESTIITTWNHYVPVTFFSFRSKECLQVVWSFLLFSFKGKIEFESIPVMWLWSQTQNDCPWRSLPKGNSLYSWHHWKLNWFTECSYIFYLLLCQGIWIFYSNSW